MRQLCRQCFSSPPADLGPLAQRACLDLTAGPEEAEQVRPGGAAPGPWREGGSQPAGCLGGAPSSRSFPAFRRSGRTAPAGLRGPRRAGRREGRICQRPGPSGRFVVLRGSHGARRPLLERNVRGRSHPPRRPSPEGLHREAEGECPRRAC